MPPDIKCDPQNCPTGVQLSDVKKSLDDTSRLYVKTHDSMTEVITTMKLTAEASSKREASVDRDIDTLFTEGRKQDKEIAKKIELSTLIKGATLVSLIFGMIAGVLRLAGVV